MFTIFKGVGLLLVTLAVFSVFSMKAPKGSEAMSGMANAAIASFLVEAVHKYILGDVLALEFFQVLGTNYTKLTPYLRKTRPEEVDLQDSALAVVEYPGAMCTVRTTSAEVNGFGRRQLVICGTKGTVEVKPLEG